MTKSRLYEFMKSKRFDMTDEEFRRSAVPNPFLDDDDDMVNFVRNRGVRQGLDKVSRSKRGSHSGVNGSRYDDMVRDIEDLDDYLDTFDNIDPEFNRKFDDDDYYLNRRDPSYRRNEFNDTGDPDDIEADVGWAFMKNLSDMEDDSEDDSEDDMDYVDDEPSRYEGIVRAIKGAYLVSKTEEEDGTYKEVWMYNVGKNYDDEANIRKAILSGTDIDPTKNFSEDRSQEAVIRSVGNVQFLTIVGVPN